MVHIYLVFIGIFFYFVTDVYDDFGGLKIYNGLSQDVIYVRFDEMSSGPTYHICEPTVKVDRPS